MHKSEKTNNSRTDHKFIKNDSIYSLRLARDISETERLAARIAEPADYFQGVRAKGSVLPENILCFKRLSASGLRHTTNPPDQHHRCIVVTAVRGTGRLCLDAASIFLNEGQAQFIAPFQFHSYMDLQPEAICWIFLSFEIPSLQGIDPLRLSRPRTLGATEWVLLREILQCWLTPERHALLPLHAGLFLARLAEAGSSKKLFPVSAPHSGAAWLARLNSQILSRLDRPLGLAQLADALGSSESRLRAKFRQITGGSLGRHLRQLRLQKACGLLCNTTIPVNGVATQCGFDSVYTFSRTFKDACGVSPRTYRNQSLEGAGATD